MKRSTLIDDFIDCAVYGHGVGYFENDLVAISCAQTMPKIQRKKYRRYGTVPAAFFKYLKRKKMVPEDVSLPERKRTIRGLLDLLWIAQDRRTGKFSEGEALRQTLLLEIHPELRKASGSSQYVWQMLEREGKSYGRLNGPGSTGKRPGY